MDDSRAIHCQNQRNFYNIRISVSLSGSTELACLLGEPKTNILKMLPGDSKAAPKLRSTGGQSVLGE